MWTAPGRSVDDERSNKLIEAVSEEIQKFYELLSKELAARGLEVFSDASGVRFQKWRFVYIEVAQINRESERIALITAASRLSPSIFSGS